MLLRDILQASHKMEVWTGSLIDYAKTFQIDSNPVRSAFLGGLLNISPGRVGTVQQTGKPYRFHLQEDCDLSLILSIHLDYLKRALLNILLNALEHANQDQKEVKLMVSVQQDQLVLLSGTTALHFQRRCCWERNSSLPGVTRAAIQLIPIMVSAWPFAM